VTTLVELISMLELLNFEFKFEKLNFRKSRIHSPMTILFFDFDLISRSSIVLMIVKAKSGVSKALSMTTSEKINLHH